MTHCKVKRVYILCFWFQAAKHGCKMKNIHSPPVFIKLAVSKLHHLGDHVEGGVEEPVEEHEPDEVVGDGELEQPLRAAGRIHVREGLEGVVHQGQHPLLDAGPYQLDDEQLENGGGGMIEPVQNFISLIQ